MVFKSKKIRSRPADYSNMSTYLLAIISLSWKALRCEFLWKKKKNQTMSLLFWGQKWNAASAPTPTLQNFTIVESVSAYAAHDSWLSLACLIF